MEVTYLSLPIHACVIYITCNMDGMYNLNNFPLVISEIEHFFVFHLLYSLLFISSFELSVPMLCSFSYWGTYASSVPGSSPGFHIVLSFHLPSIFSGQ